MNDEETKAQFRQSTNSRIAKPNTTRVAIPSDQKPRQLQSIQKTLQESSEPKPTNAFMRFANTKGGSLVCLLIFAVILATGQVNSATPFKFVLFRNVMIAIGINWWRFRNEQKNDELFP